MIRARCPSNRRGRCRSASRRHLLEGLENRLVLSVGTIETVAAGLSYPEGVAVDAAGDLFIANAGSNVIRELVKATGDIITVAGNGTLGYSGDNGPATAAELFGPLAVAVDAAGDLFIADSSPVIREVVKASGDIIIVAGNGTAGYSGDGGPATTAELDAPEGVAVDAAGDLFIADTWNNVVREVAGVGLGVGSGVDVTRTVVIGELPLFKRKLNGKGKPVGKSVLAGFTLDFGVALNPAAAMSAANYQVDSITKTRSKKGKKTVLHPITNFTVSYVQASDTVTIKIGSTEAFRIGGQLTVLGGLKTAAGGTLTGPAVFTISKEGRRITPS